MVLKVYTVDERERGTRFDRFLAVKLAARSRSQIQKEIKEGIWRVDGKQATAHYRLKEGQNVEEMVGVAHLRPLQGVEEEGEGGDVTDEVKVIAEAEDYLVIDKPAGIAVHEGPGTRGRTLVDLLLEKYPELGKVGEDPARPGIVHRLDKDVSGAMVVARTQAAFNDLKRQFRERQVKKKYIALVYGIFINNEGRIELPLMRSEKRSKHGTMKALPRSGNVTEGARYALTEFTVSKRFPRATLLAVYPQTGRTHQIRAHFRAIGHPIVGDPLYRSSKVLKVNIALARPFLHAVKIIFTDLRGEKKTYITSLPEELRQALLGLNRK